MAVEYAFTSGRARVHHAARGDAPERHYATPKPDFSQ